MIKIERAIFNVNRTHRENLRQENPEHSYCSLLKKIAGDPTAQSDRGEWNSGVNQVGELVISDKVSDELMKERLTAAGFQNVQIFSNNQLGTKKYNS